MAPQVRPRPLRRAILIVCEGAETEPCYFRELLRPLGLAATVEVQIRGDTGYTDPIGLVNAAVELKATRAREARRSNVLAAFEEVWVVFDIEHPGNGRARAIVPAVELALKQKFHPVLSRPSFEVWYLLHDRPTPPGVASSGDCIPHLRALIGGYDKRSATAMKAAKWALPKTCTAVTHGERQDVFSGPATAPAYHVPDAVGTAVHRLVSLLVKMSSDEAGKKMLGFPPGWPAASPHSEMLHRSR